MPYLIGRGKNAKETYPEGPRGAGASVQPAFAFDQNSDGYNFAAGDPPLQIAVASINLQSGSRVKIEGLACFVGAGAASHVFLTSSAAVIADTVQSAESFNTTDSTTHTCNYLGVSDPQPAGLVTIGLFISAQGGDGASVASSGQTVLTLTEILAT